MFLNIFNVGFFYSFVIHKVIPLSIYHCMWCCMCKLDRFACVFLLCLHMFCGDTYVNMLWLSAPSPSPSWTMTGVLFVLHADTHTKSMQDTWPSAAVIMDLFNFSVATFEAGCV